MSSRDKGTDWTLVLVSIQISLTVSILIFLSLWWFVHERQQDRGLVDTSKAVERVIERMARADRQVAEQAAQRDRERAADVDRQMRNLLWEVNRHSLIMMREGLALPEDQLGLPEEIPVPADPTLGANDERSDSR